MRSARPKNWRRMPGVEWVVGNSHKTADRRTLVTERTPYHGNIHVGDIFAQHDFLSAPVEDAAGDRTRPNLKIQDGCNNRCSFCIIPFVRGRSRSAPAGAGGGAGARPGAALSRGGAERHQPGAVGQGTGQPDAAGRPGAAAASRRRTVERLRLSSVEPMDFSDDLLGLMAESPRIAKHVHAPLQSGSDRTLRRMHRKYRPRHYADRVHQGARADAGCGDRRRRDGGIPRRDGRGVRREPPVHRRACRSRICTCSRTRSGRGRLRRKTAAQVPMPVRKERNRVLRELAAAKNLEFRRTHGGPDGSPR